MSSDYQEDQRARGGEGWAKCGAPQRLVQRPKLTLRSHTPAAKVLIMTTIIRPINLPESLRRYSMSDPMRAAIDEYGFDPQAIEVVIQVICWFIQGVDVLGSVLDDSVLFNIKGEATRLNKEAAIAQLKRLGNSPYLLNRLFDDREFILRAEAVGLARGMFWLTFKCVDETLDKVDVQLSTINI